MSNLISTWVVTYLVHSTVLILGALLAGRLIPSAQVRDLVWKVALVGGIVTASFQVAVPSVVQVPLASLPSFFTADEVNPAVSEEAPARSTAGTDGVATGSATAPVSPDRATRTVIAPPDFPSMTERRVQGLLFAVWMVVAAILIGRIVSGHVRLLRDLGNRLPLIEGDDFEVLERLRLEAAVRSPVRLSVSETTHSPMAMIGCEIVIPRPVFAGLTPTQRASILAHELAHVRRRDPEWLTLAQMITAVLFFQPLNLLAVARFRENAEYICDDAAVGQTGDRRALAETLAALAATISPRWWARVAGMSEGGSPLIRRVSRVLRQGDVPAEALKLRPVLRLAIVLVPLLSIAAVGPGLADSRPATAALETSARDIAIGSFVEPWSPEATTSDISRATSASRPIAVEESSDEADHDTPDATGRKVETTNAHQRFQDGSLTQSFEGPEGSTTVRFEAHAAEIAMDASWIRLYEDDGFVRVWQEAERGPSREVEVTKGRRGQTRYVYRVDGDEKEWCDDAERVVAASFLGKAAYEGWSPAPARARSETRGASHSGPVSTWSTHLKWTASVGNETVEDGVRRRFRMVARGFHYNPDTGEVYLEPDGILEIDETVGTERRGFTLTAATVNWRGEGRGGDRQQEWLRATLRSNSSLPSSVIQTVIDR